MDPVLSYAPAPLLRDRETREGEKLLDQGLTVPGDFNLFCEDLNPPLLSDRHLGL